MIDFIFACTGSFLVAASSLSLAETSGGYSLVAVRRFASHCRGFYCGAWALDTWASVVVTPGPNFPAACGIFSEQGSNLCRLH